MKECFPSRRNQQRRTVSSENRKIAFHYLWKEQCRFERKGVKNICLPSQHPKDIYLHSEYHQPKKRELSPKNRRISRCSLWKDRYPFERKNEILQRKNALKSEHNPLNRSILLGFQGVFIEKWFVPKHGNDHFFQFWGQIPRAPNFAKIHARGGGGRLTVMPRDSIPPLGVRTSPRRSRKADQSGRGCPAGGCALANGRAVAGGGRAPSRAWRSGFGGVSGGKRWAVARQKAAHMGGCLGPWCARGAMLRASWAFFGRPGRKTGSFRGLGRAFGRKKDGGAAGLAGKKPPFLPQAGRAARVLAAELAMNAGGVCRVMGQYPLLFRLSAEKSWGLRKSPSARI